MKKWICFVFSLLAYMHAEAQFAPPVGQTGTTAIYKDSSVFVEWGNHCHVVRGYQDISDTALGKASAGDSTMAVGKSDGGVVSLGDSGYAVVTFDVPVINGPGWDFAVFENSFNDTFLELAFVEVSSDGIHYFRFPAASLTPDNVQTGSFGSTDATKINNLAGKYRANYGTPFDLGELKTDQNLDVNNITHIKILDVIGSVQAKYGTKDTSGHFVNDPWPTPFASGGFDLDAVGVIHQSPASVPEINPDQKITVSPNPTSSICYVNSNNGIKTQLKLMDMTGKILLTNTFSITHMLDCSDLPNGIYYIQTETEENKLTYSKLVITR